MTDTALYYALSTIAQCAAALAALIGFFGLWRQDRLWERMNAIDLAIDTLHKERTSLIAAHLMTASRNRTYLEQLSRLDQRLQEANRHRTDVQAEQQRLMDVLVRFLIGTLVLLAVGIVGLAFAEGLHTWVWPMRAFIVVASLWLGGAPAYVVLHAAGRARAVHQRWSRIRYQTQYFWRSVRTWPGRMQILKRMWGRWRHVRVRLWGPPWKYWSERGWPTLRRWGAQARTRIRRS